MRRGESGLRDLGEGELYFIDSNIFLELELDEEHAAACGALLRALRDGALRGVTTLFHIDSILIVMEQYGGGPRELRLFLSSLLAYKGLRVLPLSLPDRIRATGYMEQLDLDFDDALTYHAMRKLGVKKIVSYDHDFDKIAEIERIEPEFFIEET
ncbi:hypothetical protein DRO49_02650 [Candidatus Bathyarchaeota archaeon]|nr:MAG: hypothetical protein DRO49_02650 [Candidatus Bathyarchaeota archaeon]